MQRDVDQAVALAAAAAAAAPAWGSLECKDSMALAWHLILSIFQVWELHFHVSTVLGHSDIFRSFMSKFIR